MISVVIPAHNEAALLPQTFASVRLQNAPHEIIVAGAGSTDETMELAEARGARVVESAHRQRAAQMNAGARMARGDSLLFLHADTLLAPPALDVIERAFRDPSIVGGGFARRFQPTSSILRLTCALAELRTRCCGWFLGDQAIFVRRSVFERLGGFREWDVFEDLDFSRRLARTGRVVTLRPPVISSGRRFAAHGALRTTWSDSCLTLRYLAGRLPEPDLRAGRGRQLPCLRLQPVTPGPARMESLYPNPHPPVR